MRKYEVTINQKDYSVLVKEFSADAAELEINGKIYSISMDGPIKTISSTGQVFNNVAAPAQPIAAPQQVQQTAMAPAPAPASAPKAAAPSAAGGDGEFVTAPIPGSILEILVKVGDQVDVGQTVVKMEAMKMENEINAPVAGEVKSILVNVGDAANQGQQLVEIG